MIEALEVLPAVLYGLGVAISADGGRLEIHAPESAELGYRKEL